MGKKKGKGKGKGPGDGEAGPSSSPAPSVVQTPAAAQSQPPAQAQPVPAQAVPLPQKQAPAAIAGRGDGGNRGQGGRGQGQGRGTPPSSVAGAGGNRGQGGRGQGPGHGPPPSTSGTSFPAPSAPGPGQFEGAGDAQASQKQQAVQQIVPPTPQKVATADTGLPRPGDLVSVSKGLRDMTVTEKRASPAVTMGLTIPKRSGPAACGTQGRKILVDTNHLALNLSKLSKDVLHYDVTIDPDRPKRLMRPVMLEVKKQFFPNRWPAFDGKKNLFASSLLPFGKAMSAEIKILDPERDREKDFKVSIKYASTISMEHLIGNKMHQVSQIAITALDIILRSAPANRFVTVGRSFFTPPEGRAVDLGDGMEMWLGFFQSAIMGWKPFVNIDVAHKGFPKVQTCDKTMMDLFGGGRSRFNPNEKLSPMMIDDFLSYIRELKVNYEIPGQPNTKRTYRVNNVAKCSREQDFVLDDGRRVTVEQYYATAKRYKVLYPFLPCLDVGSPNREKKILVPCELCTLIGGQVVIKKMTETQTTNLIRQAATSTDDRRRKIMDALKKVDFNSDPSIKEFGLNVSGEFERVNARVLEPPQLKYLDAAPVQPMKGVWWSKQFVTGSALDKWTVLSMDRYTRDDSIQNFVQMIQQQAKKMGMTISPPIQPVSTIIDPRNSNELEKFMDGCSKKGMQLVFVVVQDQGNSYSKVKQMAELKVGLLTQCLKNRTLGRMNPATCGNILLKVNAKLNGLNHHFADISRPACLNRPCMMVGADVTHPAPDQTNRPSVAAVCASFEPKAFKYNIQTRLQPARAEIIEDLEAIMRIQLLYFYRKAKNKPERIIFYRDGVSEGQFQEVLNKEFQAIRRACTSLEADYKPNITFLVVQKRHHTRLFPTDRRDSQDKNFNVPAGTIVDTIITHPTDLDFYLVSHASIQGVSRPTKYRRLWDDSNMSEDELEMLTYYLCHMFTRCTRSVSYPAPTYYAHLAAFRALAHIDPNDRITMNNLAMEQQKRTIKDAIIKDCPMFFV